MNLYVARHGETQWNIENRVQGRTDIPMNEAGFRQAEMLADEVAGYDIDLMLVSPLKRAQQTAQVVEKRCNIPYVTEERLTEYNFGTYEGKCRTDPDFQAIRRQLAYRFPGGESSFDAAARIYPFLDELPKKYPGKNLLLICHGALARTIRTYFVDMTNEEYSSYMTENCKCVIYEYPDEKGVK